MKWILIILTVFSSSAGDVLCASGMSEGEAIPGSASSILLCSLRYIVTRRKVILGVLCYALAFFSLLGLLTVAPLSVAVPATALSFVVDTLGAKFLLRERVPVRRWIGVVCVCTGVILAVNPTASGGPVAPAPGIVQAHQDQPGDHKPSAQNLDQ